MVVIHILGSVHVQDQTQYYGPASSLLAQKWTGECSGGVDIPMIFPAMHITLVICDLYMTVRFPNQLDIPYLRIDSILAL